MEDRRARADQGDRDQQHGVAGRPGRHKQAGKSENHAEGEGIGHGPLVRRRPHQGLQQGGRHLPGEGDVADLGEIELEGFLQQGIDGGHQRLHHVIEHMAETDGEEDRVDRLGGGRRHGRGGGGVNEGRRSRIFAQHGSLPGGIAEIDPLSAEVKASDRDDPSKDGAKRASSGPCGVDREGPAGAYAAQRFLRLVFPPAHPIGDDHEGPQLSQVSARSPSRQPDRAPQGPRLHHQQDPEALQGSSGLIDVFRFPLSPGRVCRGFLCLQFLIHFDGAREPR